MSIKTTMEEYSCHRVLLPICLYFLFKYVDCTSTNNTTSYPFLDIISLNCGSSENSSFNGVQWTGDVASEFLPADSEKTTVCAVSKPAKNIPTIPYLTARFFHSPFVYFFPTTPGCKFIRFHFYPGSYSGIEHISKSLFSVTVGHYTLLNNFSPSVLAGNLNQAYFSKEFVVYVKEHALNITFIPFSHAFAFVNGIEVKSLAFNPYHYAANATFIDGETAFEKIYNVDIGVDSFKDPDLEYIVGSIIGTVISTKEIIGYNSSVSEYFVTDGVYQTARTMGSDDEVNLNTNLTWKFSVDSGFKYLIRLHFCEISPAVTGVNQRVFEIYINSEMVEKNMDLIALVGKPFVAIYRDYFVSVPQGAGDKQDLWISLHPNIDSKPKFADAILNGIEIVKLSDSNGNIAAHIELKNERKEKKVLTVIVLSSVLSGFAFLILFCFIVYRGLNTKFVCAGIQKFHSRSSEAKHTQVLISTDQCRQFALAEIRAATKNFSEAFVVGVGGFGKVYKALMDNISGLTEVAIKRGNPESRQGVKEFQNEIELLSTFHHMNLVSLLGFCQDENELILVYEYMARGTLRDHLYNTRNPPLSWNKRLNICIGAARGLHYLHTSAKYTVIHRDIKSTNILLDQDWVAKVSDFGLSKIAPIRTDVTTEVKGTFGYLDPRYYQTKKLTEKSDVFSFGVVLFEVLSARPAVKPMVIEEGDKISLAQWAITCHQNASIDDMVDPFLRGKIEPECLNIYAKIAVKCLADKPSERPSMGDVLGNLEKALQLQERLYTCEEIEDEQIALMVM